MQGGIVGREPELAAVAQLLDGVAGGPAVLALQGEAGIGKTTVWAAGVERARESGFAALVCRPASAEVRLSYAGLTDLLGDLGPEAFERLPRPQHRAVDAALLRGADDDPASDPRAVAAGFLSALDVLARTTPVLVAIDDVQWLDEPTRRVVEFSVRRCTGPIATLTARRVEGEGSPADELAPRDPARRQAARLGPLSLGALHHVLKQQTGRPVPRHVLVRIAETAGGNPFFALELARSIDSASRLGAERDGTC